MLFEDLEYIINGCHYMTEDELQEFIQTTPTWKSALKRTVGTTGLMGGKAVGYADRYNLLAKQRATSPKVRRQKNIQTRRLRKAGMDAPVSPEERRAAEDYKRPERLKKAAQHSWDLRRKAKEKALRPPKK